MGEKQAKNMGPLRNSNYNIRGLAREYWSYSKILLR